MRVVAVDMTGFGKAPQMLTPFSLDDYAKEIEDVLNELGEEKVDLLAHSFGARVAVRLLKNENRIDKIIFTGAAGLKPRRGIKFFLKKASFFILKNFVKRENLKFLYSKDYRDLSPVMKKSFQKVIAEDLTLEYSKIKNRTLIVFGKRDKQTPLYMAKRMKKLMVNSSLFALPCSGHFCFIERSEEFNSVVFKFLMENKND